jgi:exonuclease VII small subunit
MTEESKIELLKERDKLSKELEICLTIYESNHVLTDDCRKRIQKNQDKLSQLQEKTL